MDSHSYNAALYLLENKKFLNDYLVGPQNESKRKAFSKKIRNGFCIDYDQGTKKLFQISNSRKREVIMGDKSTVTNFLRETHEQYNHCGMKRLFYEISNDCFCPKSMMCVKKLFITVSLVNNTSVPNIEVQ